MKMGGAYAETSPHDRCSHSNKAGLLKLPGVGNIFKACWPPSPPNKVCFGQKEFFRDGRSPRTYCYVFGDFSCHADIGKCLKYFYYHQTWPEWPQEAFNYCF